MTMGRKSRTTRRRRKPTGRSNGDSSRPNPFKLRKAEAAARESKSQVHVYGRGFVCDTDTRGYPTPRNRSRVEIVVDASEGFIPLWAKEVTLRWRFRDHTFSVFESASAAKTAIRKLLADALLAWGEAAPIKFSERTDAWDFEIVVRKSDSCDVNGCVLASAFFPDAGRHTLRIYPKMFEQSRQEQVETLVHEIGHVFGLRHFFADVSETAWPSQIFGVHKPFSIMNYGSQSVLTNDDKADLRRLYQTAWRGELTHINDTPIKFVKPFHTIGAPPEGMVAVAPIQPVIQPVARGAYAISA
jgi:hypothetical protein